MHGYNGGVPKALMCLLDETTAFVGGGTSTQMARAWYFQRSANSSNMYCLRVMEDALAKCAFCPRQASPKIRISPA